MERQFAEFSFIVTGHTHTYIVLEKADNGIIICLFRNDFILRNLHGLGHFSFPFIVKLPKEGIIIPHYGTNFNLFSGHCSHT